MTNMTAMNDYKKSLENRAEDLVRRGFPEKIVAINSLIDKFPDRPLSEVHQDLNIPVPVPVVGAPLPSHHSRQYNELTHHSNKRRRQESPIMSTNFTLDGPKVYTLPNGTAPCNTIVDNLIQTVKPHIRQLANDSNTLKMWIFSLVPKIQDGDNLGVSIQSKTLHEIQIAETKCEELLDLITEYFMMRAKIVSKVAKYPHIEDYRKAVKDLDEREYLSVRLALSEVRNRYVVLHDLVTKNYDKIKKPRSCNTDSLY